MVLYIEMSNPPPMKSTPKDILLVLIFQLVLSFYVWSQHPVMAFSTTYTATTSSILSYTNTPAPSSGTFSGCASTSYNYSFNNGTTNALRLLNITANSRNYFIANAAATIKLRRVNNTSVTGDRNIIFLESTTSVSGCATPREFNFKSPYRDAMESFLNNNYINQGTDNVFTNASNGDGNNNNIERVDVIFPSGLSSSNTQEAGFALFDRGNNNNHDGFRIAAITSLDVAGDPAGFGSLITCVRGNGANNGSWGHPSLANGNINLSVYVMRKESGELNLRSSAAITQEIGGVFFSFNNLGVSAGQTIYGYSLFGPDGLANPTNAQLLNINNSTVYPTGTTETAGGGLDLIAINASFSTGAPVLPVNISLFEGKVVNNQSVFNWKLENINSYSQLELQKSEDGTNFLSVMKQGNEEVESRGIFRDAERKGENFYRLKLVTGAGISYSSIIKLKSLTEKKYKIFPTILIAGQPIYLEGFEDGIKTALFTYMDGRTLKLSLHVSNGKAYIYETKNLLKQPHVLSVLNNNGQIIASAFIIMH